MTDTLISAALLADRYGRGDHMDGDWWWMALAMAVFWAAIIVLVVWVFRSGGGVSVHRRESADEILRRRLAEGEISVEEFETRRKAMREGGGGET